MTSQVKISEIIIPKYYPVFNDRKIRHIVLTSGRAGTKSSFAAIRSNYQIVSDPGGSVVVLRKHHNKLRKTVYKEMLRGISRLRIRKSAFRITRSPMEIQYKKTGSTIYFSGSDGIDDTKGIIDEDKPIKLVVLDELTEFFDDGEGEDELQNIEATFIRGNSGDFQMLYLYNPPKNPNAPINKWCKKMEQRPDCVHIHTTYKDVPQEWLGGDLIESAEIMAQLDPKRYRWIWLGEATGIDEAIYYMFSDRHIQNPAQKHYSLIGIGGDYGQQNATTFQAFGVDEYNQKFQGLGEYYHSGRESGTQKSPSEYARDLMEFIGAQAERYECGRFYVYLDPSAAGLAEEIRRQIRSSPYQVVLKRAENDVALGINRVQRLLTFGILQVCQEQPEAIEEFKTYEYDKKSIERGKEEPVKIGDHCMDAIRYVVMGMWIRLKRFLPAAEQEDPPYRGKMYEEDDPDDGYY